MVGGGVVSHWTGSCQDMKLTPLFHLVPRLRIDEAVILLLLCAFVACTGTTLPSLD